VIHPANTGSLTTNRKAVIRIDQTNRGIRNRVNYAVIRVQRIVTKKLIAPIILLAPAR